MPIITPPFLAGRHRPGDYTVAALVLCILVLLAGCDASAPPLKPGDAAPAFVLDTPQGRTVRLADLQGQVVAVRFWADWCPHCRNEMRALEPVYRRLHPQGLEILAVNVAQDREAVLRFIKPLGITYAALLDPDSEVARRYGVIGLPTTVFVDRAGKVRGKILGESDAASFEAMARALLDENVSRAGANPS
ncbi:MAG: TlpA family protein disulfide reductase [Thiohalomonadaceae bacterium]